MKFFVCILFVLVTGTAGATNYFVDPSSTAGAADGSFQSPWKGLASVNDYMPKFTAGDTIFFKRGEAFVGNLHITCSGSEGRPVVMAPYGAPGAAPFFQYETTEIKKPGERNIFYLYKCRFVEITGFTLSDPTMDETDHSILANVAIGINIDKSAQIKISDLRISLIGAGLLITGDSNLVQRCDIRNLRMIKSDNEKEDDDFGANAVIIDGSFNEIRKNVFTDCRANSVDYTFDGGAVEIYGTAVSNNTITGNIAINCNGFMELGSSTHGIADNNLVADNLLINNGLVCYIQKGGKYFDINVTNLKFINNRVLETTKNFNELNSLFAIGPERSDAKNIVSMENNIFIIDNGTDINTESKASFAADQLLHRNNVYILNSAKLNFTPAPSEYLYQTKPAENLLQPASTAVSMLIKFFYDWFVKYLDYLN